MSERQHEILHEIEDLRSELNRYRDASISSAKIANLLLEKLKQAIADFDLTLPPEK